MCSFLIGLAILIGGYLFYGRLAARLFAPDDRPTPALASPDGVDRLPLPLWKNLLIHLLNIAGVGPVIGVILGIKFGAIVFILLPLGNVLGGAVHDYFSGMISLRHNGANMPALARAYLGPRIHHLYAWFLVLALLLVGAVFINIPAGILAGGGGRPLFWSMVGLIFLYYFASTFFPIDKVIGHIYPFFGVVLILATVALLAMLAPHYGLLQEIDLAAPGRNFRGHPGGEPLIPMLFVTIACGIISGFHSTQAPIVARTMTAERQGRLLFYGMMIVEGLIGMIWAAGGMALYAHRPELLASGNGTMLLRALTEWLLGPVGSWVALSGVVVLAVTSGDTALRSLRLTLAEYFDIDQRPVGKRLATTLPVFAVVAALLLWSNADPDGFKTLWNYFAWSNQVMAVFALMIATVYLGRAGKPVWMTLLPGAFMLFVVSTYILWVSPSNLKGAPAGFGLAYGVALTVAALFTLTLSALVLRRARRPCAA
jgi:carbon starvation protein CstA